MLPIQQLKAMQQNTHDAARQLTTIALEGQERMTRANIDALQELIEASGEQFKKACSTLSQPAKESDWSKIMISNIQRSAALNLNCIEITQRLQRDIASITEENLRALRDETLSAVERCTGWTATGQSRHSARAG